MDTHESLSLNSKLQEISDLFDSILNNSEFSEQVIKDQQNLLSDIELKTKVHAQQLMEYGTAKLWLQYITMVDLLLTFIKAERLGNFTMHLDTLTKMVPYFAASGHHLYAKSAYLYVQQMNS